jgi:1,4-alpha-glucan branching enzyme
MERKGSAKGTKRERAGKPARPRAKPVSFRLEAPEATAVAIAGDFNSWDPSAHLLSRSGEGLWQVTVRLSPGIYQYKFLVDGAEWREDASNPNRVPNAYGTFNSVCEVV